MNNQQNNDRLTEVLLKIKKGYETGDFSELFPYLADDCVMESQWVLIPNTGYDAVTQYLAGKGRKIAESATFPICTIVELVGNLHAIQNASIHLNGGTEEKGTFGLLYTPGKRCMLMEQTLNGETHGVIVDVCLNEDGKVQRVDLCMPELFYYVKCNDQYEEEEQAKGKGEEGMAQDEKLFGICQAVAEIEEGLEYGEIQFTYDNLMCAMKPGHPADLLDDVLSQIGFDVYQGKDVDLERVKKFKKSLNAYKNAFKVKELNEPLKMLREYIAEKEPKKED